ncbi:MAG TPA: hypothetical protein VJT70_03030 [Sphingomicrobium sp.]|nr:hypothetical protein [Sphingomicrobium sp.]
MNRTSISIGIIFALMVAFFAGLKWFDDSRAAQIGVAAAYALAVFLIARWGARRVS